MRPRWLPNEVALAGKEHLDGAYVAGYDRKVGATGRPPDLDLLIGLASAPARRWSISAPAPVHSPWPPRNTDLTTNVEAVTAGFLSYEHSGAAADLVYSRHALHQLPDAWKAVALVRVADMLRPGGHLLLRLVYCFGPEELAARLEAWFSRAAASPADGWTREELETHVAEEHSTFAWLLAEMIARAGMEIVSYVPSGYPGTYAAFTCRKPPRP